MADQFKSTLNPFTNKLDLYAKKLDTLTVDTLVFSTSYTVTGLETLGTSYWDSDNHCISTVLEYGAVLQNGFELYSFGTDEGNNFPEGRAVSTKGATGNRTAFELTDASATSTNYDSYIGLITTVPDSGNRFVTREGFIRGINTTGSGTNKLTFNDEVWNEGDTIFVDCVNAGYLTITEPQAPCKRIRVGTVVVKSATVGQIDLLRRVGVNFTELNDVNGTPLSASGQIPIWDNTNKYFDFTKNINDYTPTASMPWQRDSVNGYIYPTTLTDKVGIGTSSPSDVLDVSGAIRLSATANYDGGKAGRIYRSGSTGLSLHGYAGSSYNSAIVTPTGGFVYYNPINTSNAIFPNNVGVGTNTPRQKLDILDATNPQLRLTHTDNSVYTECSTDSSGEFTISPTGTAINLSKSTYITGTGQILIANITNENTTGLTLNTSVATSGFPIRNSPTIRFASYAWNTTPTAASKSNFMSLYGSSVSGTSTYPVLIFSNKVVNSVTNETELMRLVGGSYGYLGIGTSTPRQKLDILDASNPQLRLTHTDNSVYTDLQTTSLGDLYINPSSGKVGIGTSSPINITQIATTTSNPLRLGENTNSTNKGAYIASTQYDTSSESEGWLMFAGYSAIAEHRMMFGGGGSAFNAATNIRFYTAANISTREGTERLRIDENGNIGIGETAPDTKLEILNAGNQLKLSYSNGVDTIFNTDSAGILFVDPSGNDTTFLCDRIKLAKTYNTNYVNLAIDSNNNAYFSKGDTGKINIFTVTAYTDSINFRKTSTTGNIIFQIDSTNENVIIPQDSKKLLFGASSDMSTYYDGTSGYIKTDEVAASDLHITTGTAKTVVFDTAPFDDLLGDITKLKVVGVGITDNSTENSITFQTSANLSDYAYSNYQIQHAWKAGSDIYPHIHFEQAENNVPNFLIRYRWQKNLGTKTTAWTDYKCNTLATAYTSGTINNIAYGAAITPPAGYNISDIFEIRIFRDNANTSGVFAGADPYTTNVEVTSVDIHYQRDTIGSRTEYTK